MAFSKRIMLASALTFTAIAAPLGAWYVVGNAAVSRETDRIRSLSLVQAQRVAEGEAERIGGRLETIRQAEATRPVYHYALTFHDPASDCACHSSTTSPLSQRPTDPFIRAYFQFDGAGRVSMPRLSYGRSLQHHVGPIDWLAAEERLSAALANVRPSLVELCESTSGTRVASWSEPIVAPEDGSLDDPADGLPPDLAMSLATEDFVSLCPIQWQTVTLNGADALVAVRFVQLGGSNVVQGFLVDVAELRASLSDVYYPADLVATRPTGNTVVGAPLELAGASWHVALDAAQAFQASDLEARALVTRFRRTFAAVAAAALLAGAILVGLVLQTDRLGRERAQFAASAAHELRTPLAGMRLYADMLADGLGKPGRAEEYAGKIRSEAERLGRVVSNVLGYTRLERGGLDISAADGDFGAAVAEHVERVRPALEARGATLDVRIAEDLPEVAFDADAVLHILQNLLDNAEKYARGSRDRRIHVVVEPEAAGQGGVRLSVVDHGPGVPVRMGRRLFAPFVRGDDRANVEGLGLGLTLVDGLVRAHGGRIDARSGPDGGAIFDVHLPRGVPA